MNSLQILKNSQVKSKFVIAVVVLVCSIVSMTAVANEPGKKLYGQHCSNCHGLQGEGFLKLYPPIQSSRFLDQDLPDLPCIIRYGLRGEIQVGTQLFNQVMPGNEKLSVEKIAQIIRYMQNTWKDHESELKIEEWLTNCHSDKTKTQ